MCSGKVAGGIVFGGGEEVHVMSLLDVCERERWGERGKRERGV